MNSTNKQTWVTVAIGISEQHHIPRIRLWLPLEPGKVGGRRTLGISHGIALLRGRDAKNEAGGTESWLFQPPPLNSFSRSLNSRVRIGSFGGLYWEVTSQKGENIHPDGSGGPGLAAGGHSHSRCPPLSSAVPDPRGASLI